MPSPISDILLGTRSEIIYDLEWDDYCDLPAMNPSTLVHGLKPSGSMKHLKYCWDHAGGPVSDKAPAGPLVWGRALHCLLFEPQLFPVKYQCWDGRRAGNEYKAYARDAAESGAEVLNTAQYESVLAAGRSFADCAELRPLIASGRAEVTILTVEDGVQMRHRLDWINGTPTLIVDLKSTRSLQPRLFSADFYRFFYDVKLGLYQRAIEQVTGIRYPVKVIVLEKKPPFDVAIMPVDDAVLERGARKGMEVLAKLKECIATDTWPGIGSEDYVLQTPEWEMDEEATDYSDLGAPNA